MTSAAQSSSSGSPTKSAKPLGRFANLPMYLVVGLFVALLPLLYSVERSLVSGEEFSRDSLRRRSFSYREVPFIRLQFTGIDRQPISDDVIDFLVDKKIISVTQESPSNWDLVWGSRAGVRSEGDASVIAKYLEANNHKDEHYWLKWSEANLDMAKVLWPEIQIVAKEEMYFAIPNMFRAADAATSVESLRLALNELLTNAYLQRGLQQQKTGQHDEAIKLFTSALRYAPQNRDLLTNRAASYDVTGKRDLAAADRATAGDTTSAERPAEAFDKP